jgi:hypothetical protein
MTTVLSTPIYGYEVILVTCGPDCPTCTKVTYEAAETAWVANASKALSTLYLTDDDGNIVRHEVLVHQVCEYVADDSPF